MGLLYDYYDRFLILTDSRLMVDVILSIGLCLRMPIQSC